MISLPHRLSATYSTSDSLSLLATSVDSQPEQRYDGIHSVLSTRVPNFEFRIATATACCSTCGYLWEAVFLPRLWHSALPWQSPRLRSLSHRWSPPTESRKGRLPMTEYNKARRLQRMYSFEKGQQVRLQLQAGHGEQEAPAYLSVGFPCLDATTATSNGAPLPCAITITPLPHIVTNPPQPSSLHNRFDRPESAVTP